MTSREIIERRQKARVFHRLVTGFYYHRKEKFRFLTLTSTPDSPPIRRSWAEFVRRVRKTAPIDFIYEISGNALGDYKSMVEPMRFEYCAIFTDEGYGVVHVVYVGNYLPQSWVQDVWQDIHGAVNVDVRAVRAYRGKADKDAVYFPPGLANYCIAQYCKGQYSLRHMNWSRGWVYPGFVKDWEAIKRHYPYKTGMMKIPDNIGSVWVVDEERMKRRKKALIGAWHEFLDDRQSPVIDLDGVAILPRITSDKYTKRHRKAHARGNTSSGDNCHSHTLDCGGVPSPGR